MPMSEDLANLASDLPDAELVFAFVSPLGTPSDGIQEALIGALEQHGYKIGLLVRISELLDQMNPSMMGERPAEQQERLMDAGNDLRRQYGSDYLALMAIATINADRTHDPGGVIPHNRQAYVIRSLKHPDEVVRLRHVYGKGFFLLGVSAPKRLRLDALIEKNFQLDEAKRLLDKDAAEEENIGQQTRDTFELADAYLRIDTKEESGHVRAQINRIVDLLLSCPFHPPTHEEHAMFMAYASALRSSDLSRQVGAVVANSAGDVVASGANDVPAPHSGIYWPSSVEFTGATDDALGPDYLRGYDSNERERNKILAGVIQALVPSENDESVQLEPAARASLIAKYETLLEGTGILALTEFGRAVHAEMSALMSCARAGVTPIGGTLYCTTFPCHNCAKHIVASGLRSVVYVEPYPKSKAKDLHDDAISLPDEEEVDSRDTRVRFRAFEGIGPRRFLDLFSLSLGSGRPLSRKKKNADGARIDWERGRDSLPRLPLDARSYLEREDAAARFFRQKHSKHATLSSTGEHK